MSKWTRLLDQILRGTGDANVPFDDLCHLLERMGFEQRTSGSHNVFRKAGVAEKPNLQRVGGKAKPYQVRQVREIIVRYKLGDDT
jgi:predicted RNA binding protein YcfA (HicA-like mRNA interferase family)